MNFNRMKIQFLLSWVAFGLVSCLSGSGVSDDFESSGLKWIWSKDRMEEGAFKTQSEVVRKGHSAAMITLKPGDVLEFDESAPILKATKVISTEAWEQFGKQWKDPWPDHRSESVLDELRGPVELPPVTP